MRAGKRSFIMGEPHTSLASGYHGRYLRIDASSGHAEGLPLASDVLRRFLGGSGLGTWLLLREGAATIDPLAPAAPLTFVFSPLVGSPLTTSAKFAVVGKSPLTERINDSLASSGFAIAGKKTGHDAILLTGRARQPSVVLVNDDSVTVLPAGALWGVENSDAQRRLRECFGTEYQT